MCAKPACIPVLPPMDLEDRPDPDRLERYNHDLGQTTDFLFKVVMLGQSGVGKTTLLRAHRDQRAVAQPSTATIGVDFYNVYYRYRNQTIKLQLWDTSGQERFQSHMPQYYRGAHAAVLVFALNNQFPDTVLGKLRESIAEFQMYAGNRAEVLLVGNKADKLKKRQFTSAQMIQFADCWNFKYVETSAKHNEGVAQAFECVVRDLFAKQAASASTLDNKAALPHTASVQLTDRRTTAAPAPAGCSC